MPGETIDQKIIIPAENGAGRFFHAELIVMKDQLKSALVLRNPFVKCFAGSDHPLHCCLLRFFVEYHCKCIDPWLLNNKRVCPVCKRKVIPGDSSDEEETVGQTATEPSESTPLLSPAHDLTGGPLENDLPVQQAPPLLINIEFLSDDEYDADTEDTHEKIGMVSDSEILIPSTSESSQKAVGSSSRSPGSPDLAKSAISVEENDVPLIRLSDSQDIAPPTDRS
jgi:hypothetical protein